MENAVRNIYDRGRDFSNKRVHAGCYAPFVSLFFNTVGDVLACCKNWTSVLGNVKRQSLKEIWTSQKINVLRTALLNYRFEAGCDYCGWEIQGGNYDAAFPLIFDEFSVDSMTPSWPAMIEFAGSNTCNLECVMCEGLLSSSIRSRREGLPPLSKVYSDSFFDELREFLPHLKKAKFLGGEPFLANECFRIWDMIIEEGLQIPCHVTTNGSQYNAKVERVLETLPVSLSVSIDGATKDTLETIRVNSHHEQLVENIARFREYTRRKGTHMSLTFCLMRQNWHEFGDLLLFADSKGCDVFVNTVLHPSHFSLYTLPARDLGRIVAEMEKQAGWLTPNLKQNRKVWEDHIGKLRSNVNEQQREGLKGAKQAVLESWPSDSENIWQHLTAAKDFARRGQYEMALERLLQVPGSHPDHYYAVVLRGRVRWMQGDLYGAERELEQALRISVKLSDAYIVRAWIRLTQDRIDEGIDYALRARKCMHEDDERQVRVREILSLLYFSQGRAVEAKEEMNGLLELQPEPFRNWLLTRTTWRHQTFDTMSDLENRPEMEIVLPKRTDSPLVKSMGDNKIQMKCWLRVEAGNVARIEPLPDADTGLRVAIGRGQTSDSCDVQLNQPGLTVEANQLYSISFRARADQPRSILVGFAKAHAPWTGLGLYKEIHLTREWQSFEEEFEAIASDENGRIHFDVGGSDISVELSSISFGGLPPLQFFEHAPLPPRTGQQASHEPSEIGGLQARAAAAPNPVQFGALRRLTPISRDWGWDRGLPIDRWYIENFLSRHKEDIRGRVLEVGDNSYTRKFGGDRVTVSDVLHVVEGNPQATIVADLTRADHIPSETFDCVILTQTLNRIYDPRAALKTLNRILKPNGVLLASFPGITRTDLSEPAGAWYWSFTSATARRLFEEVFSVANVLIKSYGNVFIATSFLYGLAKDELSEEELDHFDPEYEVLITVRAVKTAL